MLTCTQCGAELAEGSRFCNDCGAVQEVAGDVPTAPSDSSKEASAAGQEKSKISVPMLIGAVVLVLALAGGAGIYAKVRADQAAKEAARVAALDAAKEDALEVLGVVEKCESAVTVGVTLDDLSDMSTEAKQEVAAFVRSDSSKLMPEFTTAITDAAEAYVKSCSEWFADNETASDKYDAAVDKWVNSGSGDSPDIKDYRDDSAYQASWVEASTALDEARSALDVEAQ